MEKPLFKCRNFRVDKFGHYYCGSTHVCYKPFCVDNGIFGKIHLTPKKVVYL